MSGVVGVNGGAFRAVVPVVELRGDDDVFEKAEGHVEVAMDEDGLERGEGHVKAQCRFANAE